MWYGHTKQLFYIICTIIKTTVIFLHLKITIIKVLQIQITLTTTYFVYFYQLAI